MKTTFPGKMVAYYALFLEIGLILLQYIYLRIFHPEVNWMVSDAFMQNAGFFIFQIIGFFAFILLSRFVFLNSGEYIFRNAVLLFLTGTVVEVGFYLFTQTTYQGAFLYSVMDKIIAIAFGLIIVFASQPKEGKKEVRAETPEM